MWPLWGIIVIGIEAIFQILQSITSQVRQLGGSEFATTQLGMHPMLEQLAGEITEKHKKRVLIHISCHDNCALSCFASATNVCHALKKVHCNWAVLWHQYVGLNTFFLFKQCALTSTRYTASKSLAIDAFKTRIRMSKTMHLHTRVHKTLGFGLEYD